MLLKSVTLKNIRSYGENELTIPLYSGVSLFEGDIGSGKSTILHAIEFALFGLGDLDGKYLLRHGAKKGSVTLTFDVDGKEYSVYRSLERKGKGVSQAEGYIVENGVKTSYSVAEMKSRILQILDFKEKPQPKTTSLIYRYAVFTPQEEMKLILTQNPDKRLETLRRAFGIEDYRTVRNNVEEFVMRELRNEIKTCVESTKDLQELREKLSEKESEHVKYNNKLATFDARIKKAESEIERITQRINEIGEVYNKLNYIKTTKPLIEKALRGDEKTKADLSNDIQELERRLKKIEEAESRLKKVKPEYKEYTKLKRELRRLERSVKKYDLLEKKKTKLNTSIEKESGKLSVSIRTLETDIRGLENEIERLKGRIDEDRELTAKKTKLEDEVKKERPIRNEITQINNSISTVKQKIQNKREEKRKKNQELNSIKSIGVGAPCPRCKQPLSEEHYRKITSEYEKEITQIDNLIQQFEEELKRLNDELVSKKKEESELQKRKKELQNIKSKLAVLQKEEKDLKRLQKEYKKKEQKLSRMKQSLSSGSFATKYKERLNRVIDSLKELESDKQRYDSLKEKIDEYEKSNIIGQYSTLKATVKDKPSVKRDIGSKKLQLKRIEKKINEKSNELKENMEFYEKNKGVIIEYNQLDVDLNIAREEKNKADTEKRVKSEQLKNLEKEINQINQQISEKKKIKQKEIIYEETVNWLDKFFIPCIEAIEKHTMVAINSEFNESFQRWFNELIETGDITVRVDENFTPVVEQEGYELEVNSLSGGERSAVALAYRLALNTMVKRVCEAMRTNLLILDEPTDGFSSQQLGRLRNVLRGINCDQIIMVSHEAELESMVDRVYRVSKEEGLSKITF